MANSPQQLSKEEQIIAENSLIWQIPEYQQHNRSTRWYIIFFSIVGTLIIYSIFVAQNFLFALILIMSTSVTIIQDRDKPRKVNVVIGENGIMLGNRFYDYGEFDSFSVVYKPNQDIKKLYLSFQDSLRPYLIIPLEDQDPLMIREVLSVYVAEDQERSDELLSESVSKILKI